MTEKRNDHPLPLIGVVLMLNSVVLAGLSYTFAMSGLFGVTIGCAVAGFCLTVIGFNRAKRRSTIDNPRSA